MATVTKTIHVKVVTFDPAQGRLIAVPNAKLLCEDSGFLYDPDLSSGNETCDADGLAQVQVTFDDTKENSLNPFFTITVPSANRDIPSAAPAEKQFHLPDEWVTRHYVNRRIQRISDYTNPNTPLTLFVGLHGHLRVSYSDFDASGKRNPLALPEDTVRIHLADYDDFLWIDFLNPDDTLTGFGFNPKTNRTIPVGEGDQYPYFDTWPTAAYAFDGLPALPKAWIDPPGASVGRLGGGSFEHAGPLAADPHGFLFMADGNAVRRFYPDGTLCETITEWFDGAAVNTFNSPGGLAVDQYRNLFVADTQNNRIVVFALESDNFASGKYAFSLTVGRAGANPGEFNKPIGVAVVPNRIVDGDELLAVADSGNKRVQVFNIDLSNISRSNRAAGVPRIRVNLFTSFGAASAGVGQFTEPVGVAADRKRRLFVCDRALHRVSRWKLDGAGLSYIHEVAWEKAGGGSGGGNREFNTPEAIAIDTKNNYVYVAERANNRVQRLDAESGDHMMHWLHNFAPALANPFTPTSVAVDARGEAYLADTANHRVLRGTVFDANGVRLADSLIPNIVGAAWTPRSEAGHMNKPGYVYFGRDGKLWVSDSGNNRVLLFERNPAGELAAAAGPPSTGLASPVGSLSNPVGIVADADGNLFVVDSDNNRIRKYNSALAYQADLGQGTAGPGPDQFNHPRGIAIAQRTEPILYVADRGNNRVQILKRDGTFTGALSAYGTNSLSAPEDVAVDSRGNLYVADTGNSKIVQFDASNAFVRAIAVTLPSSVPAFRSEFSGISIDDSDKLIVTDRSRNLVIKMEADGTLLAFWDMKALLSQTTSPPVPNNPFYYPELARQIVFDLPSRAVVDSRGLMAVADTGHDQVRLLRIHTDLNVNLFDLGEGLPDISFRAVTKADWTAELGLKLNVGDVSIFDDSHDFITDPISDFALDEYEDNHLIGAARHSNAAINVMKVVRSVQRWYQHHSRKAEEKLRWGTASNKQKLNVDLQDGGTYQLLDVNLGNEESGSPHGRGADAWDDSVAAHEMSHWVFFTSTSPYPLLPLNPATWVSLGVDHGIGRLTSHNLTLSEGWAEYVETFWGAEYGSTDRIRGFAMTGNESLTFLGETGALKNPRYLFGGTKSNVLPDFSDPGRALQNEGYFANALYQLHHALTDPEVMFADASSYWYQYNANITDEESQRFSDIIWKSLDRFSNDPPFFDKASEVFLKALLDQAYLRQPAFAQTVQTIFELNNLLTPVIIITEGTSDSAPGANVGDSMQTSELQTKSLIVQVKDATNRPLPGYNLNFDVSGSTDFDFRPAAAGPAAKHGRVPATGLNRATNANGIVNIVFEAPPGSRNTSQTMLVTYQPDFDTDETFAPPERADDKETTLRKLYLYELRAAAKIWAGAGTNFGAKISKTLRFDIKAS